MTVDSALALINLFGLLLIAIINYLGNRQTHKLVNSRMTELLELTRSSARAAGIKEELDRASRKK